MKTTIIIRILQRKASRIVLSIYILNILLLSPFFSEIVSSSDDIVTSENGDYPVFIEVTDIVMSSGHNVEVIIYYPGYTSRIDKQNRNNDGPFPLVIFSPGAGGGGVIPYTTLVSDLASFGFIVAGVSWEYETNREEDVAHIDHTLVIDTIEEMSSSPSSPLFRLVDTENCGAYGHSRGGRSAYLASGIDSRIKAISAWMPTLNNASAIDQSTFKLLFAGRYDDVAYPSYWTDPLYESCDPLIGYVITEGDHSPT